jgi:hypothetical protein
MKNYQDKIDFYSYKVNKCIANLDTKGLAFYTTKLSYFMKRQAEANRAKLIFGQFPA